MNSGRGRGADARNIVYAVSYGADGDFASVHSIWASAPMALWQACQLNSGQDGPWVSVSWEVRDGGRKARHRYSSP